MLSTRFSKRESERERASQGVLNVKHFVRFRIDRKPEILPNVDFLEFWAVRAVGLMRLHSSSASADAFGTRL